MSKYNTVIVRKTNFVSDRVGFLKYPSNVNYEEVKYVPTWTNIPSTDIYLGDISNDTRNDLKFYISDWEGANSGYVYYISFSTKTQSEILENYNFIYK